MNRNKEFGVYISLGMDSRELMNLVLFENIMIAAAALVSGMFVGALFSRLFQMILISFLELKGIEFSLDSRSFLATILIFVVIFTINFFLMSRKLLRSDILNLLTAARKNQKNINMKRNVILGSLGVVILVISAFYLHAIAKNEELYSNPLGILSYMILAFIGVYLFISEGGILVLTLLKKSKFYYSNMLTMTQLQHKFNQNKKIIFILAILSTMNIFCVASPFSLLNICESIAKDNNSDLEFAVGEGIHENYEEVLKNNLTKEEIQERREIPLLIAQVFVDGEYQQVLIIDANTYNDNMRTQINVPTGSVVKVILDWEPSNGGYEKGDQLTFQYQEKPYTYEVVSSTNGKFLASSFCKNLLILNNTDYTDLANKATSSEQIRYCIISLTDWKSSKDAVMQIEETLESDGVPVNSVAQSYLELKQNYSVFLFAFSVLGILFFIAGGMVLYFRQYAELPEAKKIFAQLFKIGISLKETKTVISKQLLVIFYIPVIFGSYLGLTLIYLMTHLVGGVGVVKEFMTNASYVVLFYLISQVIFYFLTRRKYMNAIETYCIHGEYER
jgi:putative ABC transport system permease protein